MLNSYDACNEKFGVPKKRNNKSGKKASTAIPSWATGQAPFDDNENGNEFAKRLMNDKYGRKNWDPRENKDEFYKLRKYGDRAF